MTIGMHGRHPLGDVGIVQMDDHQLAALLVLMPGAHALVCATIGQAKLPATDITAAQGDHRQRFTTGALSALTRHDQQLVVRHLGGAVMFFGQTGDEVKI
ncbi:hypothetical protein D3C84_733500 [compost metagenome]